MSGKKPVFTGADGMMYNECVVMHNAISRLSLCNYTNYAYQHTNQFLELVLRYAVCMLYNMYKICIYIDVKSALYIIIPSDVIPHYKRGYSRSVPA